MSNSAVFVDHVSREGRRPTPAPDRETTVDQLSLPIALLASGLLAVGVVAIPLWLVTRDPPDDLAGSRPRRPESRHLLRPEDADFVIWNVALPRTGIVAHDHEYRDRHARGPFRSA
jgi:hypothetical protein